MCPCCELMGQFPGACPQLADFSISVRTVTTLLTAKSSDQCLLGAECDGKASSIPFTQFKRDIMVEGGILGVIVQISHSSPLSTRTLHFAVWHG